VLIRTKVSQIREQGRTTQGVTLIALGEGEKLAGLERVVERDEDVANGNGAEAGGEAAGDGATEGDGSGTP
jgi:DNA gyrase subunit A